jgi:hypothetical protein
MRRIATLAATLALLATAPAVAQASSTCQAYNPQTCKIISSNQSANLSTTPTDADASSNSTLPFTGLDALLLVVGGGTMVAVGFAVRRLARRLD